jgi:predicted cupin superfamily sugar epimerase
MPLISGVKLFVTASSLIDQLQLLPHPEGGYYKETYRSPETVLRQGLPERFLGDRSFSTAIYFLLPRKEFSAFHRIKSDECWHHYAGGTLLIHVLGENGEYSCIRLGAKVEEGEVFQAVVPGGAWFASEPAADADFVLVGCTVSPGFDFADFEMAEAETLVKQFPAQESLIRRLCRQKGV